MKPTNIAEVRSALQSSSELYSEFLRVPDLSCGLYRLAAGSKDPQSPHNEDEVYYVISGLASIQIGEQTFPAGQGDVIYVEKKAKHHFFDIKEDLELLVFFAPAET
ncbi:MAG: cupin domain-containing protein [Planctomycetaceae bacterium]